MELTIPRPDLARALISLSRVIESRNTIPILGHVALRAADGRLSISGTDLDIEASADMPCNVDEPGAITVNASALTDMVKKLPDEPVSMRLDENQILLRCGRSRVKLHTLPIADFPEFSTGEFDATFTMPAAELRALFAAVSFAVSTDETRYYLNGVYLEQRDGALRAVATDGHRLAHFDAPVQAKGIPAVIVPRKTASEMERLLERRNDDVTVSVSKQKIMFAMTGTTLASKLIDGTFPDYQRVIPTKNDKSLVIQHGATLAAALARVSTVSSDRGRAVKLSAANGVLTLEARNPDIGDATDQIDVTYDDAPIEIGFNARYLADILDGIAGPVELRMNTPGDPAIIKAHGSNSARLAFLMPMRV